MNTFGEFLYTLRKEKGMTQAELARALGVTNKAVSKWETGEAMPETALLLPLSRIFGVSVDELLAGERAEKTSADENPAADNATDSGDDFDEIKNHLFTRGKDDDENKTLAEKICGFVCAAVFFAGLTAYLLLGAIANLWHPYWVIVPACALACGIIGVISDTCNPEKRAKKLERGQNPYTGCACGIIMLTCLIAFLCVSAFTGLWHPLWIIVAGGVVVCFVVGALGDIFTHKKK